MIWNYVDPGIGGLILQGLIAGAAAIWLFFREIFLLYSEKS
jgi:hypothetical protein